MTEIRFYHLERTPLESALPKMLEMCLSREWRAVVMTGSEERASALSDHLWTFDDRAFLPHGDNSDGHAADQPVWLTATGEVPEGRDVLFALRAEDFDPEGLKGLTRAILMFTAEGAPPAREAWKAVKAAGLDATYWKQDPDGRWVKAA